MEERNVVTDGVHTKADIDARKAHIDKVWATFPDLCRAITEEETKEDWKPDRSVVVDMIEKDTYVRKAIDFKLK